MHVVPVTACGHTTVCRVELVKGGVNRNCNDGLVDGHNKMAEVLNGDVKWGTGCWWNALQLCLNGGGVGAGIVEIHNKSRKFVKKETVEIGNGGGKVGAPEHEDGCCNLKISMVPYTSYVLLVLYKGK